MTTRQHILSIAANGNTVYLANLVDDDGIVAYEVVADDGADVRVIDRGSAPGTLFEVAGWLRRQWRALPNHSA